MPNIVLHVCTMYACCFCIWIGLYGPNGLTPAHNAMPKLSAGKFMTARFTASIPFLPLSLTNVLFLRLSFVHFRKECFLDISVDHASFLPICSYLSRQASAVSLTYHGAVLFGWCCVGICYNDIPSHEMHAYICSAVVPLSLCLQGAHMVKCCVVHLHVSILPIILIVISGWSSVSVVSVVSSHVSYYYCAY